MAVESEKFTELADEFELITETAGSSPSREPAWTSPPPNPRRSPPLLTSY